jgi:hypothetical protein
MPRKKFPKPEPLGRIQTYYGIVPVDVEIWANTADEGGRGSWKRRDASTALTILIETYTDRLLNELHPPKLSDLTLKRLLGNRQTSNLVEEIKPILRKHRLSFGKTALWLLAAELQKTFIVLRNAIESNQSNLGYLPSNSPEFKIRQKMSKGTF